MATKEDGYAIIRTGGKQYRVKSGDVIDVERLSKNVGDKIDFEEVLFYFDGSKGQVGKPVVTGCKVSGELVDDVLGPKVIAFKYKKRKHYQRKLGHRQNYSRVKITAVGA